jgi:hypothetical protein
MSTTTLTPRQSFRDVLGQVVEQARTILPEAVNGRIESAVKLVLAGDVLFNDDGTAEVASASEPTKTYTLAGGACDCQDFAYGKAPQGYCQHRIAANLARSVERVLARRQAPLPVLDPEPVEPWGDNDLEGDFPEETPPMPPPPPAPALPEAPVSITLKALLHGHEVLVTLRGTDFASVKAQVEEASAWLKAQAPRSPATSAPQPQSPACPTHGPMKPSTKGKGFFCPHKRFDGSWCPGK